MFASRRIILMVSLCILTTVTGINRADAESLRTQVVMATYRLENPKSNGTGFIIRRSNPKAEAGHELLLVTAAHVFEKMDGNQATLVLRKQSDSGDWVAKPTTLQIREHDKPTWLKHPNQDVAVMSLPRDVKSGSVSLTLLAGTADWKNAPPDPGTLIRSTGFPHAAQFKPSKAGFPLTRIGCIASYPLTPIEKHPTFLVDYNTFEGDSGGPVYCEFSKNDKSQLKIVGLVHGQHFLDERYKMAYQSGLIRKRLGLAIIVNSQAIIETIDALDQTEK